MKLDKPISAERVRRDFDRIAHLQGEGSWDHNSHYHRFLLGRLPRRIGRALEVGCGTGSFARLLAERAEAVLGLDLSPEMIAIARERSARLPNVEFLVADALSWEYPSEEFDCVASIATLHHLPLKPMLERFRAALRPVARFSSWTCRRAAVALTGCWTALQCPRTSPCASRTPAV
mgnify:CR=1 FL=1